MTIGDRIRHAREALQISQVDLAEKIGVSKQSLYKYENSIITNIPSDKIEAIAFHLKTTPAYLMGWEEKKQETFSEFEKELISRYRAADNITQEIVKRALELDKAFKKDEVQSN